MSKNVMITGASGFLGVHVMRKFLSVGFKVSILNNHTKYSSILEWQEYAVKVLEEKMPDLILNIGSSQISGDGFKEIIELTNSNVIAPAFLASFLSDNIPTAQLITISTSWQYDASGNYKPFNLYAASKQALDDYLMHYGLNNLKITSLILFDTYSETDHRRKILNLIKWSLMRGEKLDMTAGEQVINLTHICDVASAVLKAYQNRQTDFYNGFIKWAIKSTNTIKVKDLLNYVDDKTKLNLITLGARPYREREIFQLYENVPLVPGWEPVKIFDTSIKELLAC